ncbi:BPTD_3080 family restriction endonuclease [Syntrophus buswellii]|uniref:BPTD_3080 family restriction endonuclease n=1 Tax=Syntrophus buswellii TaxID=43774 RepID=UPI0038D40B0F
MSSFEVNQPILNSPYDEPAEHWYIEEGLQPERRKGRRKAGYFYRDPKAPSSDVIQEARGMWLELALVNQIRALVKEWRTLALRGEGGVTRTTQELLNYWRRDGRQHRLFFAQLEAAETIIFLKEARGDFLQGIDIPVDNVSEERKAEGFSAFQRYACKMATGSGKTTVMGMLAAWSILNKINDRMNALYSDVILIVCPNVTIRNRLQELDPSSGEASLYRTRDLVPPRLMPDLAKGRVLMTNWHVFEQQVVKTGGIGAKVTKTGIPIRVKETITIGKETTTARGKRYLTLDDFQRQLGAGILTVISEDNDKQGNLKKVFVESLKYVESDTAMINRILGREVGGKQNILVFNDEAHHAYRISRPEAEETEDDLFGEIEESVEFFKEATVWIDGLDRIHKLRKINFCVDLSATPYYLGRVGQETNRTFPWVVCDFGLTDAIESGLVKIPQLAVRDTTGAEIPGYFNVWRWILPKLTPAERGGKKGSPKPEAILKWANTPVSMLAGLWEDLRQEWEDNSEDPRPPVFILVCKNTKIAKMIHEWLAADVKPAGIPSAGIAAFRNTTDKTYTIRVDSKVVHETDSDESKGDESTWMRFTLDTVGKIAWPMDKQGRPIYPEGFDVLAHKLKRPLHPPGRDVRCIVSVGMLTEGWDCSTVTHIVGLRPFMSQLLCEQVVGRGLRRSSYQVGEDGKLTEEVAKVFGVPFEVIPFKENKGGTTTKPSKRYHISAVPAKKHFEIIFPRVEGYRQAIRNRISVDWDAVATLDLDPLKIPPEVQMKAGLPNNNGRYSLTGPGKLENVDLNPYRQERRFQELTFQLARDLIRDYASQPGCEVPVHILFPQITRVVENYLREKVKTIAPANILDVFLSPYYGWVIERLVEAIKPDTSQGEAPEVPRYETNRGPGSTADVDYWTSKDVREVVNSHLNYAVADTKVWEQSATYLIDTHKMVDSFVKNAGLGFAIPYLHNGQSHDYIPDFIIRLKTNPVVHLILETKGFDDLAEVKRQAAQRWVNAVNADANYGIWKFSMARKVGEVRELIDKAV